MALTESSITVVGQGGRGQRNGHMVEFYHRDVGRLIVCTGIDNVSWGYGLNTQRYPTYGGEVVQILSAYVDDLEVGGTLRSYKDMEALYTYFFTYVQRAAGSGERDEVPMSFEYAHRDWKFDIIVTSVPGYRKATELTVPEWKISAHVVDGNGDVDVLSALIAEEAAIKSEIGSTDGEFSENFGLEGKIRYIDENPFSDPWTDRGTKYDPTASITALGDFYAKLLPAYIEGDFDAIFGTVGAKPAFNPESGPKGNSDKGTTPPGAGSSSLGAATFEADTSIDSGSG